MLHNLNEADDVGTAQLSSKITPDSVWIGGDDNWFGMLITTTLLFNAPSALSLRRETDLFPLNQEIISTGLLYVVQVLHSSVLYKITVHGNSELADRTPDSSIVAPGGGMRYDIPNVLIFDNSLQPNVDMKLL